MSVESFLHFVMNRNELLIETLVGLILLLAVISIYRWFFTSKSAGPVEGMPDLSHLEDSLKKILEKASHVPAPSAGGTTDPQLLTEIADLKKTLQEKQNQIEQLKSAPAPSAGGETRAVSSLSDDEKAKLEEQIKELQSKLAEYEIISEDIADLSFYKEENVRLKKQIEELQAGASARPAAAAPVAAPAAPQREPEPRSQPVVQAAPAPTPSAPAAQPTETDDDLMKEFAAAVESQKASEVANKTASGGSDSAALDINVDMDKMLAEAGSLDGKEAPDISADQLNQELDPDKLLSEADQMNPDDKQLMGEFENFVKKEGAG